MNELIEELIKARTQIDKVLELIKNNDELFCISDTKLITDFKDLQVSIRLINRLRSIDIYTPKDIIINNYHRSYFYKVRDMGTRTINELAEFMKQFGYVL